MCARAIKSEAILTTGILPTINADRCVHGRSPIAQCSACAVACPRSALELADEGLIFDEDLCDGCALCAPACPEQAIDVGHAATPYVGAPVGADRAFVACEKVVAHGETGVITCLHALSTTQLARLHAAGIGTLVVAEAECRSCTRHHGETLSNRVSDLTRLLNDRGLAPFKIRRLDATTWREERDDAGRVTRRSLFRSAFGSRSASRTGQEDTTETTPNGIATADFLLGARDRATIAALSPTIDQSTCVACGACVAVCAHGALRLSKRNDDKDRYEINATLCTGCALCVDSCEPGAISLLAWGDAHPPPVQLTAGKCRICSSPFHVVAQSAVSNSAVSTPAASTSVCHICAAKTDRQKLFQVQP